MEIVHISSNFVSFLMVILCMLAGFDLYRQYLSSYDDIQFYQYSMAVKSNDELWTLGYRIENLEEKLLLQQENLKHLKLISKSLPILLRGEKLDFKQRRDIQILLNKYRYNNNNTYELSCEMDESLLRIGANDFRTDSRDSCMIYTGDEDVKSAPNTMFEKIEFSDGTFGFRSLANNLYLQSIAPISDDQYQTWKLGIGGAVAGVNEKFRISPEGYLYSSLAGGFFYCKSNSIVTASTYGSASKFRLSKVPHDTSQHMRDLASLSNQIQNIQKVHLSVSKDIMMEEKEDLDAIQNEKRKQVEKEEKKNSVASEDVTGSNIDTNKLSQIKFKICIGTGRDISRVPITSKGTKMTEVSDSPLWTNLFDSFMESIDWHSNKYHFGFYFGFDKADEIYDTGDAWSDMREEFRRRARESLEDQRLGSNEIEEILKSYLSIKLQHFDHLTGAPSQVVSQLMLKGYSDGFDYFYQVNDDTQIITPNWASRFIAVLESNPIAKNVGVTGPLDRNNNKIFTHSFTHRTHYDIFGHLFPPSFKNWWSDDWISLVYGELHTFRVPSIEIQHNVGSQKKGGFTRYDIDQRAHSILESELMIGFVQVDKWLLKHSYARLPLPVICDYIPLVKVIEKRFRRKV